MLLAHTAPVHLVEAASPASGPVRVSGGMGAVLGFAAGVVVTSGAVTSGAVTSGAALFGARAAPVPGLVVLLVPAAAAVAAVTTFPGAMAAGAQCWACWDGFLVNGLGTLTADHGGWQGLVLFLGCAAAANHHVSGTRRDTGVRGGVAGERS